MSTAQIDHATYLKVSNGELERMKRITFDNKIHKVSIIVEDVIKKSLEMFNSKLVLRENLVLFGTVINTNKAENIQKFPEETRNAAP